MSDEFPERLPGFDRPLELLHACHERILRHCDLLEQLIEHLSANGPDEEARKAAARIHRYFSTSAGLHHEDEEKDIFPLLGRQSLKLADLVHGLRQEHRRLDALWARIGPGLNDPRGIAELADFAQQARAFCEVNRHHIALEETELLVYARNSLSSRRLEEIGTSMAQRRGARFP
jgi:hemerythrin-like domain-containing protein